MFSELSSRGEHSLRQFFENLVWRHFTEDVRLEEPSITQYVSDLLSSFAHIKNLYQIRNAYGKQLDDVGEMLV